jgi:hypothetical protein
VAPLGKGVKPAYQAGNYRGLEAPGPREGVSAGEQTPRSLEPMSVIWWLSC